MAREISEAKQLVIHCFQLYKNYHIIYFTDTTHLRKDRAALAYATCRDQRVNNGTANAGIRETDKGALIGRTGI